jgi:nucleoside-diphosphate-sugar epimerase
MTRSKTVFIAGASGVIGSVLCRLLLRDGWEVHGATRSSDRAGELDAIGVKACVVDVFDREALIAAVCAARPTVVVHQLTDLPKVFTDEALAAARPRNAKLREVGTANLVAAAQKAGARRLVAQSIAFAYAPGSPPYDEEAPLDAAQYPSILTLEELVLGSGLFAVVLRYGRLYGPGTWTAVAPEQAPVHVEAAAEAARLAMTCSSAGVYNVAEEDSYVTSARARRELKWDPGFRW